MTLEKLRRLLTPLAATPLHPQWLVLRLGDRELERACREANGTVLDVGCGPRRPVKWLPPDVRYIGLDYLPTARDWYGLRPDLYADAQRLPIDAGSVDCVFLLDVLEHLPDPRAALEEIRRVLNPSGRLVIQVPFLYPLHDQPLDFRRWTSHGLRHLAVEQGFVVEELEALGSPIQCACLLGIMGCCREALEGVRRRSIPRMLMMPFLPLLIVSCNLLGWLAGCMWRGENDFMPLGYHLVLRRQ